MESYNNELLSQLLPIYFFVYGCRQSLHIIVCVFYKHKNITLLQFTIKINFKILEYTYHFTEFSNRKMLDKCCIFQFISFYFIFFLVCTGYPVTVVPHQKLAIR